MFIPHFAYPFTVDEHFDIPVWRYYPSCFCEHLCTCLCVDAHFHLPWVDILDAVTGSYGEFMFNFFRNCQNVFPSDCTNLHSHDKLMKVPDFHIFTRT